VDLRRLARTLRAGLLLLAGALALLPVGAQPAPTTQTLTLSGTGPDDAVEWDFRIDGGMRAGEAARIKVPSNWQQHGFGHYQYGYDKGPRAADTATYRRRFTVPADWQGRTVRIVFDAVMTDTLVKLNGQVVGPVHQGGFNRFSHDVTRWLKPGEDNDLEVQVSEASAEAATDIAERHGDYWVFGGIYRPVWLEASPPQSIAHVAIHAQASGELTADVTLRAPRTATRVVAQVTARDGTPVGAPFGTALPAGGAGRARVAGRIAQPLLWTAETPHLYQLQLTLMEGDRAVHQVTERFGFRTFEVRAGQGLFLNGQRLMLKGINRHSFRPDTGRAVSRTQAYEDARLIKSMNMNAMRVAHYAPEKAFLEAADELGLYVINELSGWQAAHGTEVGRKLVRALVERDVNHPSILLWSNGNEGGWNRELDGDFALHDPQARPVIHPWEAFGGIDTKHYPRYPDLQRRLAGPTLVLPTEFLHGLFDGGLGAGLDDYWRAMKASPRGAGGFLWNLADEGVARTDQGGRLDLFGGYAPDGIVGPRGEKETSYFTVKEIWSPVQIDAPLLDARFNGVLKLANEFDFTTLAAVRFRWEWIRFSNADGRHLRPAVLAQGELAGSAIAPHATGALKLPLPAAWQHADALQLTATRGDEALWTWVWAKPGRPVVRLDAARAGTSTATHDGDDIRLQAGTFSARFDARTGLLLELASGGLVQPLANGPRLVVARPRPVSEPGWQTPTARGDGIYEFPTATMANIASIDLGITETDGWAGFRLELSPDGQRWQTVYDSARVARDGQTYLFAPQPVKALRVTRLAGVRRTPAVVTVKLALEAERFAVPATPVRVATGSDAHDAWLEAPGTGGLERLRWTLRNDGVLVLDYAYPLQGPVLYHGITFDRPQADARPVRALARGPQPVWQSRLRGPVLGVHELVPGGYFAEPRWLRLPSAAGDMLIVNEGAPFLQLGARLADFPTTSVEFPAGDLGFLHAIPAMGAKGQAANLTGPAGQPALASGRYEGRLLLKF
jgi:hypothetical protein